MYLRDDDVVLVTYSEDSNEDGGPHFQRFCFDIGGVRDVAQLYIDALYELDRYVSRLRKKDFERGVRRNLVVALVEAYPVFDFRPMNYHAAHADLPIRRLARGYQGVALGIVY